ncbi:MAG: hypothetical protein OXI96_09755 [Acidimicrobiaceae bacterium]|nr:hypothetical protein [Acidimicrobiaceae bacterium]
MRNTLLDELKAELRELDELIAELDELIDKRRAERDELLSFLGDAEPDEYRAEGDELLSSLADAELDEYLDELIAERDEIQAERDELFARLLMIERKLIERDEYRAEGDELLSSLADAELDEYLDELIAERDEIQAEREQVTITGDATASRRAQEQAITGDAAVGCFVWVVCIVATLMILPILRECGSAIENYIQQHTMTNYQEQDPPSRSGTRSAADWRLTGHPSDSGSLTPVGAARLGVSSPFSSEPQGKGYRFR